MLAIRLQRAGRKGHAMFRLVVQDSRRTPSSGTVVARLGSYDPHTKSVNIDKDKVKFYLEHGAHPSERMAGLLKKEGVKLPKWVTIDSSKAGKLKNPEKLRRNHPKEEKPVVVVEAEPEIVEPEVISEAVAEPEEPTKTEE